MGKAHTFVVPHAHNTNQYYVKRPSLRTYPSDPYGNNTPQKRNHKNSLSYVNKLPDELQLMRVIPVCSIGSHYAFERYRLSLSLVVGGYPKSITSFEFGEYIVLSIKLQEIRIKHPLPKFNWSLTMDHPKHEGLVLHGRFKGLDGAETNLWSHFRGSR